MVSHLILIGLVLVSMAIGLNNGRVLRWVGYGHLRLSGTCLIMVVPKPCHLLLHGHVRRFEVIDWGWCHTVVSIVSVVWSAHGLSGWGLNSFLLHFKLHLLLLFELLLSSLEWIKVLLSDHPDNLHLHPLALYSWHFILFFIFFAEPYLIYLPLMLLPHVLDWRLCNCYRPWCIFSHASIRVRSLEFINLSALNQTLWSIGILSWPVVVWSCCMSGPPNSKLVPTHTDIAESGCCSTSMATCLGAWCSSTANLDLMAIPLVLHGVSCHVLDVLDQSSITGNPSAEILLLVSWSDNRTVSACV